MDMSLVPVLGLITLGILCAWGYVSAVGSYDKARDPDAPKSSLAADAPRPCAVRRSLVTDRPRHATQWCASGSGFSHCAKFP
jgi:hypothetical protein